MFHHWTMKNKFNNGVVYKNGQKNRHPHPIGNYPDKWIMNREKSSITNNFQINFTIDV